MAKKSKQTPPKLRRPTFRPNLEFKVRCGGGLHTIKLVRGAMVLADHTDRDKHEAMVVQAALSGADLKCIDILKNWRNNWFSTHPALRDTALKRYHWKQSNQQLCKTPRGPANSPKRCGYQDHTASFYRDFYDNLHGRSTPKEKLTRTRKQYIEGVFRQTLYRKKDYYGIDPEVTFSFGRSFRFLFARSGHTSPEAKLQLPYDWRQRVGGTGLAVTDGHLVVDILEKLDVGHRVLVLRLVDINKHPGMSRYKAVNYQKNWRAALSDKPTALHDSHVIPVIAEATAYPKRGGKSHTLVWTLWKKPITAEEERL